LELVLGDGVGIRFEPVPALPQAQTSTAAEITTSRILISKT
jgi:hypothetical protein